MKPMASFSGYLKLIAVLAVLLFVFLKNGGENTENAIDYALSSVENINITPEGVFNRSWRVIKNSYIDKSYNHQTWDKWPKRYKNKIKTKQDSYVAIDTMMESLNDPYSRFLKPDEFEEQDRNIDAKLFGIGVHISEVKGKIIIVNIIEDTPASKSGLKAGDRILKVNNESIKGLSLKDVAEKIRGIAGSTVTLEIIRNNKNIVKQIRRESITIKAVKSKMLDNNIAYIKITTFISNDTSLEVLNALNQTKSCKGIILDLRGNHGGLLPNAIEISNMFLKKGTIVSIVDRNNNKETIDAEPYRMVSSKPLVVLIDGESASASEILSGALKDHKRAVLVGEKTFGKGLVQRILRLPDGSGLNLTIAKYLTPKGYDINKKGIQPDISIKLNQENLAEGKDNQLKKAIEVINKEIARSN